MCNLVAKFWTSNWCNPVEMTLSAVNLKLPKLSYGALESFRLQIYKVYKMQWRRFQFEAPTEANTNWCTFTIANTNWCTFTANETVEETCRHTDTHTDRQRQKGKHTVAHKCKKKNPPLLEKKILVKPNILFRNLSLPFSTNLLLLNKKVSFQYIFVPFKTKYCLSKKIFLFLQGPGYVCVNVRAWARHVSFQYGAKVLLHLWYEIQ